MPQKKNPDLAELSRGKAARVVGNLMALLTLLKGLPMTYNRDLQEDKERLFDTADTVRATTRILAAMLRNVTVNVEVCERAAADPHLLATDLADHLVTRGLPFRDAHHVVGRVVAAAEQAGKPLTALTLAELREVNPAFGDDALDTLDPRKAMSRRRLTGAPGTGEVRRQLRRWQRLLGLKPSRRAPTPA
jgi:argininosuccinate lyase